MTLRCIVLLGIGHTHAEIIRRWIDSPIPNCRLICITNFTIATYSGMFPGALAGQFDLSQMQIDLKRLTEKAGADLILNEVIGVDTQNQTLLFDDLSPLRFDLLSIGIGSVPKGWGDIPVESQANSLVGIKPMQTFQERLELCLNHVKETKDSPVRVVIVGGGLAGCEIALCLKARMEQQLDSSQFSIRIITVGDSIGGSLRPRSIHKLNQILQSQRINTITNARVCKVNQEGVIIESGQLIPADCVVWCTGAVAPQLLSKLNLPTDCRGFLKTKATLQSTNQLNVFAVGDSGSIVGLDVPKAGVYAVRQAPILWHNIQAMMNGTALMEYQPQLDFLKILNTGDGKALLQYKSFCWHGAWCRYLKNWIDDHFIRQYQR